MSDSKTDRSKKELSRSGQGSSHQLQQLGISLSSRIVGGLFSRPSPSFEEEDMLDDFISGDSEELDSEVSMETDFETELEQNGEKSNSKGRYANKVGLSKGLDLSLSADGDGSSFLCKDDDEGEGVGGRGVVGSGNDGRNKELSNGTGSKKPKVRKWGDVSSFY
jgi:hypothetical protein